MPVPEGNLFAGVPGEEVKPGAKIGPYTIEQLLGAGGIGEVYHATDTRLNRPVAIKCLSTHVGEESARRRFQQEAKTASSNANGVSEIWLRSLEEGWARPVVASGAPGIPPWHLIGDLNFSPDGSRIVYNVMGADHTIWASNIAGARPVRIDMDTSNQHGPSWSPNGNWVSYFRLRAGKWEIAKVPIGGGSPVTLMQTGFSYARAWSPSGEWIGYNNADGLALVSPDGKSHRVLDKSETGACCGRFGFSKDGTTVYLLRRGPQRWEIVSIDVRTATQIKVSELPVPLTADLRGFSLHPNGKSFATAVGTSTRDIWLIEDFARPAGRLH